MLHSFFRQNGFTPLNSAAEKGHELVVQLLLASKASIEIASKVSWLVRDTAPISPVNGYQTGRRLIAKVTSTGLLVRGGANTSRRCHWGRCF